MLAITILFSILSSAIQGRVMKRSSHMKSYAFVLLATVVLVVGSCKGGQHAVKIYDGAGVVVSVDHNTGTVEINHEDIEGFMPAMTMPFKAVRPSLLDKIEPGDKVEFKLRDDGSGVVLVKIEKKRS
jgi:Cu/Ag efflux protein CusF